MSRHFFIRRRLLEEQDKMSAYVITQHPCPRETDLKNYKLVRELIIHSFSPAQQIFLRKYRWKFRKDSYSTVKIIFDSYFTDQEDSYFRILFSGYKLFNYCKKPLDYPVTTA